MNNRHIFNLYERIVSAFSLIVDGLPIVSTWTHFFNIRSKIIAGFKVSLSFGSNISIKNKIVAALQTSDGIYPTFEIRLLLSAAAKLQKKLSIAVSTRIKNSYIMHFIWKPIIDISPISSQSGITIGVKQSYVPQISYFYPLSYFDGSTLSTLDSLTLAQMDKGS